MRYSIIYSLFLSLLFFSCRKEDNSKIPDLNRVPIPLIAVDPASDQIISPLNPTSFKGKINVDLYFENDKPQKFDIVVMKNENKGNVKVLKADVTTFPSTIDFTGQDLITLFGAPIADGDQFDIGVDVTNQNGQKFQAFPLVGDPYGTGTLNQPGMNTTVQFIKPCPFKASDYNGNFEVISDEWNDYPAGAVIPVKMLSENQLSFEYNVDPGSSKPIILKVNPENNWITITKQEYGSYGGDAYFAESAPSSASSVNPCDLSLSIRITHSTAGFSGAFTIRLKKKV